MLRDKLFRKLQYWRMICKKSHCSGCKSRQSLPGDYFFLFFSFRYQVLEPFLKNIVVFCLYWENTVKPPKLKLLGVFCRFFNAPVRAESLARASLEEKYQP